MASPADSGVGRVAELDLLPVIMRKFIIFFEEKEGTSAVVRVLAKWPGVTVVHQAANSGWEPFDRHNCGEMPIARLGACLDTIYGDAPIDFEALNRSYTRTAVRPLEPFAPSAALGLKMRFRPPARWAKLLPPARAHFRKTMIAILKRHDVTAFVAVRQDVFRWALSKYHGDGTGRRGHLQFKLADAKIGREEIPRIHVDPAKFDTIVAACERSHVGKRTLMSQFRSAGVKTAALLYEKFSADPEAFFTEFFRSLGAPELAKSASGVLAGRPAFDKAHSDDISTFVENHSEILDRFGRRYVAWKP